MARKDPEVELERVRRICNTMPKCFEKLSHGHIALLETTVPGHHALVIKTRRKAGSPSTLTKSKTPKSLPWFETPITF